MAEHETDQENELADKLERKARKKRESRQRKSRSKGLWFGLGTFELVGW